MNKKALKMINRFYDSVGKYIKNEYKPKWSKIYNDPNHVGSMLELTAQYYLGGNTVCFTAGQIVDLLKSKYGK